MMREKSILNKLFDKGEYKKLEESIAESNVDIEYLSDSELQLICQRAKELQYWLTMCKETIKKRKKEIENTKS